MTADHEDRARRLTDRRNRLAVSLAIAEARGHADSLLWLIRDDIARCDEALRAIGWVFSGSRELA